MQIDPEDSKLPPISFIEQAPHHHQHLAKQVTANTLSVLENILNSTKSKEVSGANLMDFTDEEMKTVADGLQSDSKQNSKIRVTEVINEFEKRQSAKEAEDQEFLDLLQMKPPEEETSEVEEEPPSVHSDRIMNN